MATFYVSPFGNDASSGTSSTGAFATLARAQQAMRASSGADTTYLANGTYTLTSPLALTSADSGSSFTALDGAQPVVTLGRAVGGWTVGGDGIWRASVPLSAVSQFTVAGIPQTEARFPNANAAQPITGGWLWAKPLPSGRDPQMELAYDTAALPAGQVVAGARVTVFSEIGYDSDVLTIASVNTAAGIIRFTAPASDEIGPGSRFFVSGAPAQLDQAGEWWFDATSKTLSFRPPAGFTGTGAVASGGNQAAVTINGANNVAISGLTFADNAGTAAYTDDVAPAVSIANATGVSLTGNRFLNVGKGVLVDDGGRDTVIAGNRFEQVLANAIDLTPGSSETLVSGNTIIRSGTVFRAGGAIQMTESGSNTITGNRIEDVPRFGIAEFNYSTSIPSGGNVIEYNTILRSGQQTTDTGAIYVFSSEDSAAAGDLIRYNRVVEAGGLATTATGFVPGRSVSWGIYLDDGASNAQVVGNFVSGTALGGVMLHGGTGNRVSNNILLDNDTFGIEALELSAKMTGTTIDHNVVEIPHDSGSPIVSLDPAYISPGSVHNNIYISPTGIAPRSADQTYASWRSAGGDAGSDVVTSAGFVNPSAGNYAFAGNAFALTQGISQLPWSTIDAPSLQLTEGSGANTTYTFVVSRAGALSTSLTVPWSVVGAGTSPAAAADFAGGVLPSGNVTFQPGETMRTVSVVVAGDTTPEPEERFALRLAAPAGSSVGARAAVASIVNDDTGVAPAGTTISMTGTDVAKAEGTGAAPTAFTFTLSRTGNLSATSTVAWSTAGIDGSGTMPSSATDFAGGVLPGGTVTFQPGEATRTLTVPVAADGVGEFNERFAVTLANPSSGTTLATAAAGAVIYNDDTSLALSPLRIDKAEGNAGTTTYAYTVTRTGITSGTTQMAWGVTGGGVAETVPAVANDFSGNQLPSGTLVFAPGETTRTITIAVAGDTTQEGGLNESFTLALANPQAGVTITAGTATGVLFDDESIRGSAGNDTLTGTPGSDFFVSGTGLDTITGGAGRDTFHFLPTALGPASSDAFTFTDFSPSAGETLNVSQIDAIAGTTANDSFRFIGTAAFSGQPGELRWANTSGGLLVQGNVDTGTTADLTLLLKVSGPVNSGWFVL